MVLTDHLSPEHLAELTEGSSIGAPEIEARGYRTLYGTQEDRDFLKELGYRPRVHDREDTYPALLVPVIGADGEPRTHQIKPRVPLTDRDAQGNPRTLKYVSPPRTPMAVDIPAATRARLEDGGAALWITEGMKKVDSLVSAGCAAIGLLGVWNWRSKHGTLGDWEDVPIKGRSVVVCFDADAAENRHVALAMARLGAWLATKGAAKVYYLTVPATVGTTPVKGVDDFFTAGGTLADLFAAATLSAPGAGAQDAAFSDAFLVEELVTEALEGRFCWVTGLGWMRWGGRTWSEVSDVDPVEAARVWASERFNAVHAEQGKDPARDMRSQMAGWRGVLANNRLRALVNLSKGLIQADVEEFDAEPDLLTVQNGTVNLRTGELLPFDPSHRITRMAGAHYVKGAQHPKWVKALEALPGVERAWMQERYGQALTGYKTPDHKMVIGHGGGSNGKSTITNVVRAVMGQYGVLISDRVLMASPDAHPTELMDLRGARYAVLEETPEARHLNTQRLKTTVGTDSVKARRIRQDPVEFIATHSLFINTNYRPVVTETDHGTWRRLALVDYPFTFKAPGKPLLGPWEREGDPSMEYAHQDGGVRSAALWWMIEGAQRWYANDRMMTPVPDAVERTTHRWRAETDLILGFCDEMLRFGEGFVTSADMLRAFNEWSGERQHRPWNDKTFAGRFAAHDAVKAARVELRRKYVDGRQQRGWEGVSVRGPGDDGGDPFGDVEPPEPEVFGTVSEPEPEQIPEHPVNAPVSVGFDLETADADELFRGRHEGPFVRLAGGIANERGFVSPTPEVLAGELDRADVIYGHGILRYDLVALAHHHGADYDELAAKAIDTEVLSQLADPPSARRSDRVSHTLDAVAKRLGHDGKSDNLKVLAKEFGGFDRIPLDEPRYVEYLRGDLDATRHVYENLSVDDYARREMRVQALLHRMTLNGWAVDVGLLDARVAEENERRMAAAQALHAEFGMPLAPPDKIRMRPKKDWPEEYADLKVTEARQLDPESWEVMGIAVRVPQEPYAAPWATDAGRAAIIEAFAKAGAPHYPRTKTGALALSSDALGEGDWYDGVKARPGMLKVYGDNPRVRRIVELLSDATGATAKYAEIREWTTAAGRVHAETGAPQASGRWATTHPASANLGKRGAKVEQRRVFTADTGHVLITCDLSQVDVRAVAALSQDPAFMALLEPGRDYHSDMAEIYFGDRGRRKDAKPISHGLNYGQGARAVAERNGLDLAMVQRAVASRAESFPRLIEWTEEVRAEGSRTGRLDNGFGRLMKCDPERAYTQAPALMGQGAARDIMTESLLRLVAARPDVTPYLRGVVHDEVIVSVPEGDAEEWAAVLEDAFTWEWRGVPILCDVSRPGKNWAECAD